MENNSISEEEEPIWQNKNKSEEVFTTKSDINWNDRNYSAAQRR